MHGPATALLPGPEPSLHAHAIRLRVQPGAGGVAVIRAAGRVVDEAGARVTGAAVAVRWTVPGGGVRDQQAATYPSGQASFRLQAASGGPYDLCVTGIVLEGYTYDAAQKGETCSSLVVP